jgi:phosphoserine phosphatase
LLNEAFFSAHDRGDHTVCKSHVLDQFRAKRSAPLFKEIWVIGDSEDDLKLLALANRAFVMNPERDDFMRYPHIQQVSSFAEILEEKPTA